MEDVGRGSGVYYQDNRLNYDGRRQATGATESGSVEHMFWLKACPKCQGDLYGSNDIYGSYVACLQCSRYLTEAEETGLRDASSSTSMLPVAVAPKEALVA